jgi:DNA-binding transcriptional ArsR family regulator
LARRTSSGEKAPYYWRIAHNRQVDDLLVELIDLLISIRYAHPAMVQLEMILDPPSRETSTAALLRQHPGAIAYAEVDDALIVTMTRILGLCWAYDYERTPALTPEQLAELTGRPRSTLYRHLKQLREMQWIRVDQAGRRIIIRPIVARNPRGDPAGKEETGRERPADDRLPTSTPAGPGRDRGRESQARPTGPPGYRPSLGARLAPVGQASPSRSLTNPIGNIILKLESGRTASRTEFLRAAEEQIRLREWMQEQEEPRRRGPGGR